jgi:hypothetical protein
MVGRSEIQWMILVFLCIDNLLFGEMKTNVTITYLQPSFLTPVGFSNSRDSSESFPDLEAEEQGVQGVVHL